MKAENHPIKASSGTAGLLVIVLYLIPEQHRHSDVAIYVTSTVSPFIVWVQNWCWRNGGEFAGNMRAQFNAWKVERQLKGVLEDPLISSDHKTQLQTLYSKSKTDSLVHKINSVKDSL